MCDVVWSSRPPHVWRVLFWLLLVIACHTVTTMFSPCLVSHPSPERVKRDDNNSSGGVVNDTTTARPPGTPGVTTAAQQHQQPTQTVDWIVIIFYNNDTIFSLRFFIVIGIAALVVILIGTAFYYLLRDDSSERVTEKQQLQPVNGIPIPQYVFHSEPTDGKLATSAQMYHYQHQKQKILAAEHFDDHSEADSDHEQTADGVYTVYGCPGLASMEDMEVTNPHFEHEHDDDTVSVASGASADKQEKFD